MIKKQLTLLSEKEQQDYLLDNSLMELTTFRAEPWLIKVAKDKYGNVWVRGRELGTNTQPRKIMWHSLDKKFEDHKGYSDEEIELC